MTEVNFHNIRKHNTSQPDGFEELCCQLLSLCAPASDAKWIRKNGSGGDAGVEAFWQLANEDEICLQAKFFDDLGSSQWAQIDKSVSTMLAKHPKCTRYIICLPIDFTDKKQEGKESQQDKWNKRVEKWLKIQPGREIEFVRWGAHELTEMLTRDDPLFAGRRHYWFNEKTLTKEWFSERLSEAVANLGDRYTPEMHVDLPIARRLSALVRTPTFWRQLADIPKQPSLSSQDKKLKSLEKDVCRSLELPIRKIKTACDAKTPPPFDEVIADIDAAMKKFEKLQPLHAQGFSGRDRSALYRFESDVEGFKDHLHDNHLDLAHVEAVFLTGKGGIGKSHLLADLTTHCIDEGLPAVLLLGQQLAAGQPWQHVLGALDFTGSVEELLGALDAAGQAHNSRALFAIDALNEGAGNSIWPNELPGFATRLAKFPNITFVASCRSPFDRRIGKNLKSGQMLTIKHHGFAGHEEAAAQIFMDRQGIARPSAPLLAPEFSNPLFLSTVCKSLHRKGETSFPKGLNGVSQIFQFYFDSVCDAIEFDMGLDPAPRIVGRTIEALVDKILATESKSISVEEATAIADNILPSQGLEERSLVRKLVSAGVLTNDVIYLEEGDNDGQDVIRITYERYLDHLRAKAFIDEHVSTETPEEAFKAEGPFRKIIGTRPYYHMGFIEALSSQVPERFERELCGLIEWPKEDKVELGSGDAVLKRVLQDVFSESLLARVPTATNEDTLDHLNELLQGFSDESLDALVRIATEPGHFLNAKLLHRNLWKRDIAERDALWSVWAAKNWYAPDGDERCTLWMLAHWAWHADTHDLDEERVWLACITLTWLLSAPRRGLRDKATKALVSLIGDRVHLIRKLLLMFDGVDDFYILERLYCVAYGVAMRYPEKSVLGPLGRTVFNRVFRRPDKYTHILLRDYARGIVQLAARFDALPTCFDIERASPPYQSEWPIENVSVAEIETLKEDLQRVYSSVDGYMGDFGNYTMKGVFSFSATTLDESAPASWEEVRADFIERLAATNPDGAKALAVYANAARQERDASWAASAGKVLKMSDADADSGLGVEIEDHVPEEGADALHEEANERLSEAAEQRDALLTKDEVEAWRWMSGGHRSGDIAKFSRSKARRWIVKRVSEVGWTKERFDEFEQYHCGYGPSEGNDRERMGKKYQWIAYHALLAHLADHCHFLDFNSKPQPYLGAWQLGRRDIDPSYLKSNKTAPELRTPCWWETSLPNLSQEFSRDDAYAWVRDLSDLPSDLSGIRVSRSEGSDTWLALDSDTNARTKSDFRRDYRTMSHWINAAVVERAEIGGIQEQLVGENIVGMLADGKRGGEDTLLGEYPWHESWHSPDEPFSLHESRSASSHTVRCHLPITSYYREAGEYDHSNSDTVTLALPSELLIDKLGLQFDGSTYGYRDTHGRMVWFDPWAEHHGKSSALILANAITPWLVSNQYSLMWTVVTQKTPVLRGMDDFVGELSDQQLVFFDGQKFNGHRWTIFTEMGPTDSLLREPFKVGG